MDDLKLIVLDNIESIGKEVDDYLKDINKTEKSYMMEHIRTRFNNGEGKMGIDETARDKDVFILSDVGNYSTYSVAYGASYVGATRSVKFFASQSNSIYGNSTTVQPPALTMRYIIKY